MSRNTSLSELINYVSASSNGNVTVAPPASGFALEVFGTGRYSGALSGSSATFTGALTGTSATFSGNVTGSNALFTSNINISGSATSGLVLQNSAGGESPNVTFLTPVNRYNIDANAIGTLRFFTENTDGSGGVVRASIDSAGAATFSSTVTTGGQLALTSGFGTSTSAISIYNNTGASASNIAQIDFRVNNTFGGNERVASIIALNPNASANNGGALVFSVSANGTSTTPTEDMRIDSIGNVIINTTITGADGLNLNNQRNVSFSEGSGESYANMFRQRNTAALVIADGYKRSLTGTFASSFSSAMARAAIAVGYNNGSIAFFADPSSTVANGTDISPTERMTILNSGNVGIGTTSPGFKLDVRDTSTSNVVVSGFVNTSTASNTTKSTTISLLLTDTVGTAKDVAYLRAFTDGVNVLAGGLAFDTRRTDTTPVEAMRITSGGNVGIGTTAPGARLDVLSTLNVQATGNSDVPYINFSNNGRSFDWGRVGGLLQGDGDGALYFSTKLGGGVTEKIRITSSGNVGIGTTTPLLVASDRGNLTINGSGASILTLASGGTYSAYLYSTPTTTELYSTSFLALSTNGVERMRITSGGGVAIGATAAGGTYKLRVINAAAVQTDPIFAADNNVYNSILVYAAGADGYSGAATVAIFGRNTSTNRSINAGGTINASGADYAEYMTKAIDDVISKGDIVGVNSNGLLTNIFADAISFVVKSTDPSYVGGDTWGNIDDIGKLSIEPTQQEKDIYNAKVEAARQRVDRIAFSGQVPCNVLNAQVGDYIIPIELENGKISGQAVTNPTFEQYQISVGKVWKIMEDGRAWIAVKIG